MDALTALVALFTADARTPVEGGSSTAFEVLQAWTAGDGPDDGSSNDLDKIQDGLRAATHAGWAVIHTRPDRAIGYALTLLGRERAEDALDGERGAGTATAIRAGQEFRRGAAEFAVDPSVLNLGRLTRAAASFTEAQLAANLNRP